MTTQTKTTTRLLWTAQVLLALLFAFAGVMKFVMSPEDMQQGPIALPLAFLRFIGAAEVLGALGLLLPALLHVRTELTALAASGLTVIMIGASVITVMTMGVAPALFPFIVCVIAAAVAVGRWQPLALRRARKPAWQIN